MASLKTYVHQWESLTGGKKDLEVRRFVNYIIKGGGQYQVFQRLARLYGIDPKSIKPDPTTSQWTDLANEILKFPKPGPQFESSDDEDASDDEDEEEVDLGAPDPPRLEQGQLSQP